MTDPVTANPSEKVADPGAQTPAAPPPHFIVIVPGWMGSKLRDKRTGQIVWIDFTSIPLNPLQWEGWLVNLFKTMAYPNDDLEPAGIVEDVLFALPWAKMEQYSRLLRFLGSIGYKADESQYSEQERNVYSFAYDWRQDNRISGRQLGAAIDRWRSFHPGAQAWVIAHSNGGLVARWYIEKEGGKQNVGRLFLMASPWDGAPKAMHMMFNGLDTLFRRQFNLFQIPSRTRSLLRTLPSIYSLLPYKNPFLRDLNNEAVSPFDNPIWLDNQQQRDLLADARRFDEELGNQLSVETLCFFGRKEPTTTYGIVHTDAGGHWSQIDWGETEVGDGTLPERTAVFPGALQKLPFVATHGDIYVNPAVLEFLRWELVDKYAGGTLGTLDIGNLTITFEPDQDFYEPGGTIKLWTTIQENGNPPRPRSGARIRVELTWSESLPGSPRKDMSEDRSLTELVENQTTRGRYEGQLTAPQTEGYYRLRATVELPGEPGSALEELIAVEA